MNKLVFIGTQVRHTVDSECCREAESIECRPGSIGFAIYAQLDDVSAIFPRNIGDLQPQLLRDDVTKSGSNL